MTERVLVTGARAAAALDIARSLRSAGYEPHLADCSPARLSRWSQTAGPVHRYASPVWHPAAFASDIRELVDRLEPAAILPSCEEVFHLAALARDAGLSARLFAPAFDRLATLHAKDRFAALCGSLGLPAPATRTVTDRAGLEAARRSVGDAVFKPVWSRFGARAVIGSPDSAIQPSEADPWVVQRRIVGEDVSFYAVCHDGRVTAFSAYGSVCRAGGGAALVFNPVPPPLAERLRLMADALAAWAGTGQLSCDAVVDADGRAWLIECNPRATSGVHLFDRSAAFGRALLGRGEAAPDGARRHLGPALWLRDPAKALRGAGGLDVLQARGDPLPPFGALIDAAVFGLDALRRGSSLTAAMTSDIEWNGEPLEPSRWAPAPP